LNTMAELFFLKFVKILIITTALLLVPSLVPCASPESASQPSPEEKARQRMLEREAANALWRLKSSLEKDAFYSTRIRLNVWRSTALDAGKFDQKQYDEFKRQLYEKSVNDSLKCFDEFLSQEYFHDAQICLQTWRMHSKELGTFDQESYEALKKQLLDARERKAELEKEKQNIEQKEPDS